MPVCEVDEVHETIVRAPAPEDFASFDEPGWVTIVWTLGVDSLGSARSRFHTETRALTTDAASRAIPSLLGRILAGHSAHQERSAEARQASS